MFFSVLQLHILPSSGCWAQISPSSALTLATRGHCLIQMRGGWHGWPHDLSDYHRAQPETVACLTGHSHHKSCSGHVSQADSVSGGGEVRRVTKKTTEKNLSHNSLCQHLSPACVQRVWRDLSSPRPPSARPITPDARLHKCRCAKGEQNKRLSEKSSHRPTVDCQPCFQAEALVLRADKLALLRSAQPLRLQHEVGWRVGGGGRRGPWLHQHPLGEALWLPQDNETYLKSSTGARIDCSLQRLTHKTISSIFTQGRGSRVFKGPVCNI